jgi:hypothetical protein
MPHIKRGRGETHREMKAVKAPCFPPEQRTEERVDALRPRSLIAQKVVV